MCMNMCMIFFVCRVIQKREVCVFPQLKVVHVHRYESETLA